MLAVMTGLYPIIYFLIDRKFGLLSTKSNEVLEQVIWNTAFYIHIVFGGTALLIGWIQFSEKLRKAYLKLHRNLGKLYVSSVLLSSIGGIYMGFFATGGIAASIGFISLGVLWFYVTAAAFITIKKKKVKEHQTLMIYSYALCFAAVTLRIWLPLLTLLLGDFNTAYPITAWVCWVPNLIFAYFLINNIYKPNLTNNPLSS